MSDLVAELREDAKGFGFTMVNSNARRLELAAADEIERLTAELCGANAAHDLRATRQADEIGRLRAALEKYATHLENCHEPATGTYRCTCGLREALAGTSNSQQAPDISDGEA